MRHRRVVDQFSNKRIVAIEVLDASKRTTRKPLDLMNLAVVKSAGTGAVRESGEKYGKRPGRKAAPRR